MKKIILVLLSILVGATLFVGCGDGITKMEVKDEMNGTGTNKIGEYGVAYYTGDLKDSDIIDFYNNNVKDSKLKYVSLINKDNKEEGYVFPGADNWFNYGKVDKDGMLSKTEKMGTIKGDKIEYSKSK